MAKRVFLVVLDSLGIGALPDAAKYGDEGANTLRSAAQSKFFAAPNLAKMGLFNIEGVFCREKTAKPTAAFARLCEMSEGKDTVTGHWEIAGVVSDEALNTFPNGFPKEIVSELEKAAGRKFLCNLPYSGTEVIKDFGQEHLKTGSPILYTSADSVMQIAAHESVVPLDELYGICEKARELMRGEFAIGRIIARPFDKDYPNFVRTANRRDFALDPPEITLLDVLKRKRFDVVGVGKISEVFNGKGITQSVKAKSNGEAVAALKLMLAENFEGLCFANLVDFDSLYGHRRDVDGYAKAITEFDKSLDEILPMLKDEDLLIITADHGCDPLAKGTDHTREYVPMLIYGDNVIPVDLGTLDSFADLAATVAEYFETDLRTEGVSFLDDVLD